MSLNVALNTALSGLFAHQRAIAATSENIANVSTPDFTRREAQFSTDAIPDQFAGVDVTIARAATNRFLAASLYRSNSDAAEASVLSDALSAVEASLGAPGENVSFANALDDAFAAIALAGAAPSSLAARADALAALDNAFAAFARTQGAIAEESDAALSRASEGVARVNALLEDIHRLNQTAPESAGAQDLLSQRLTELSALISIEVTRADNGQATVTTAAGTTLASAGGFAALGLDAGPPARLSLSSVNPASGAGVVIAADAAGEFAGGEIAGLLTLVNTELPRLSGVVDAAARGVATSLNAAYAQNAVVGSATPTADPLIVEAAGRFSVNAALLADPARFAIARPTGGAVAGANDGSGAAALGAVAQTPEARNVAEAVALIGSAARNADLDATTERALADDIAARAASDGGVNLDEELSNLILYQRAYGANARVIAAVDELWRTLLETI